jgi:hypothetical protein
VIALLNKCFVENIKKESINLLSILVALILILKLVLFKESLFALTKFSLAIFWLFLIPGFFFMYIWDDKLNFIERIIISVPLSSALIGIASYNLALFGMHIKYHGFLPVVFLLLAFTILYNQRTK